MNQPSDRKQNILPAARRLYFDLKSAHGKQTGALIEAIKIAQRRAEADKMERDWRERHGLEWSPDLGGFQAGNDLLFAATAEFKSMCGEFGPKHACHVLVALEVEQVWAKR